VYAEINNLSIAVKSYKTMAQENIQKEYKTIPVYRDIEEEFDDKHNVIRFRSEIMVKDLVIATGF
jgi:dsRNA-specific ribonuclease